MALAVADQRGAANVVEDMHSGLALLMDVQMDVHLPERLNGIGLVHVAGGGWSAPLNLDSRPLKEAGPVRIEALPLVERVHTVLTINHRATPRLRHPTQIEDAQRAVRFMRFHTTRFGIAPARIGAIGGSSGGHLVNLRGILNAETGIARI